MKKSYFIILPVLILVNCLIFYYQNSLNQYIQGTNIWGNSYIINKKDIDICKTILQTLPDNHTEAYNTLYTKTELLRAYSNVLALKNGDNISINFFTGDNTHEKNEDADRIYETFVTTKYKDNPDILQADLENHEKILDRLYYIKSYSEYIENISHSADLLSSLKIYKNNKGFIYSNILKTKKDFYGLEKITLILDIDEGIELLLNYRISDIFAFLICLVMAVITFELIRYKTNSTLLTKKHHFTKGAITLSLSILSLYIITIILTGNFIGLGNLNRSLQSSESFKSCTLIISTGFFLSLWVLSKLIGCLIIYSTVICVITWVKDKLSLLFVIIPILLFFIIELILYTSNVNSKIDVFYKEINFFSAFDLHRFFTEYFNINFLGQAVSRLSSFIIFIIILLILSTTAAKKGINSYTLKTRNQAEQIYFDEINTRYIEFRNIWHDMQNHLLALNNLIENNDTISAKNYISEFNEKLEANLLPIKTGLNSAVLDALLFKKLEFTRDNNIDFEFNILAPLDEFNITDYELCSIFGNIIDNAIEAVLKLPYDLRRITLSINRQHDMVYICCENPYNGKLTNHKDGFLTSKIDKNQHGIGLSRIKGIVKKHRGNININTDNNTFKIELLLN